mgnify:FL=1
MVGIKALIFDKDGTLFPYNLWREPLYKLLCENLPLSKLNESKKEECISSFMSLLSFSKDGSIDTKSFVFDRKKRLFAIFKLIKITIKYNLPPFKTMKRFLEIKNRYKYFDGSSYDWKTTIDTLSFFKNKGILLALFSNDKMASVEKIEEYIGSNYFRYIITNESKIKKPSKKTFLEAERELKIPRSSMCFVSDTPEDLMMARKAKVKAIAIEGTFSKNELKCYADIIISSLEELKSLIE